MMTTTAAATDTSPMMIRMNSSNDPIEDLNRTLYDIGAQDLLDVWEAMEATVRYFSNMIALLYRQDVQFAW